MPNPLTTITLSAVQAARERIAASVLRTPCLRSELLSRLFGCELFLKLENLQVTGSFKARGALNKMLSLDAAQKAAGVIAASAGNHAQGVARAAQVSGIKAVIVMPETAPLAKIEGTRAFGAEIVLHGSGYDAAFAKAQELQQARGLTFIHAFDDAEVIAGQGTIGLELLEQLPQLDIVVVPVGGGGLIAGIASALKPKLAAVRLIGVETARLPAMQASLAAGHIQPLPTASTLADGISVAVVGQQTFPIVQRHIERIVTVSEAQIASAILLLLEREKILAEGAGAVGIAAVRQHLIPAIAGQKVAVIVSGGNIDMTMLARIIERGLESDGRLVRLKVVVADKPGALSKLTVLLAQQQANVFNLAQSRPLIDVELGQTEVEFILETKGWQHVRAIVAALRAQPDCALIDYTLADQAEPPDL